MLSLTSITLATLASFALALPTTTSPEVPHSTITSAATKWDDLQPEGAKNSNSRPFVINQASEIFVERAAEFRNSGVPAEKASSVASVIFEGAIQPRQYTSLAAMAASIYYMNGDSPSPQQLYEFATDFHTAYAQERKDLSYWSLVNYIRTESSIFNTQEMLSPTSLPPFATGSAYKSAVRQEQRHLREVFASLEADPTGAAAIETLDRVAGQYYHDITFTDGIPETFNGTSTPMNSSFIERALMSVLSTI